MDNTIELETIKTKVEKLNKEHQLEILKILRNQGEERVKINENKSGVYINLSFLPLDTIEKIKLYLNYVQDQEKMLCLAENQKEDFAKTYFEDNQESESMAATTSM